MSEPIQETQTRTPKPLPEGYISKKELIRLLNCSLRSINEWMSEGRIPFYKFGKRVGFKWSEVESTLRNTCRVYRKIR